MEMTLVTIAAGTRFFGRRAHTRDEKVPNNSITNAADPGDDLSMSVSDEELLLAGGCRASP